MRLLWRLIVFVAVIAAVSPHTIDDWTENTEHMDLAIGIHYNISFMKPGSRFTDLVNFIEYLAQEFVRDDKTRMAIVDFGAPQPVVLLEIKDGTTVEKVKEATAKIGQGFESDPGHTVATVARQTREKIFPKADSQHNEPKLVMVVSPDPNVSSGAWDSTCRHYPAILEATSESAHIFLVEGFVKGGDNWQFVFTHSLNFPVGATHPLFLCHYEHPNSAEGAGNSVTKKIKDSLKACVYKESEDPCYINTNGECVQNFFYELAFKDSAGVVHQDRWKEVKMYCYENMTYPCGTDQCSVTGSTRTTKPVTGDSSSASPPTSSGFTGTYTHTDSSIRNDADYYYADDPYVIKLKIALIALGVAVIIGVIIDVLLVRYACRLRKQEIAKEKLLSMKSAKRPGSVRSPITQRGWTVEAPPEMTKTPADVLVKQYAKK